MDRINKMNATSNDIQDLNIIFRICLKRKCLIHLLPNCICQFNGVERDMLIYIDMLFNI